jgi:hypothetical protein
LNQSQEQAAIVGFLADPASHGAAVERHTTHISELFLAGDHAYKLKRAVKLPYLDFSTIAQRHSACDAEVTINRRTAPSLYLGVAPIIRNAVGRLTLGRIGETRDDARDWVVVMRRFDPDQQFDRLAAAGALNDALIRDVVDQVSALHRAAMAYPEAAGAASLRAVLDESLAELADAPGIFPAERVAALTARSRQAFDAVAVLLDRRATQGRVRHCHGDLHLGNICLFEGRPTLFDAIEFDESFAVIDVLYDLAFLVMDLLHRDLRPLANQAINRYLETLDEFDGLPALGFFLGLRAIVRAKIAAIRAGHGDAAEQAKQRRAALAYLALAEDCLVPRAPRLIAVGGLSGSGKTTVARGLAAGLGPVPGAVIVRSDVVRKQLAGVAPESRLDPAAYTRETAARIYEEMRRRAGLALNAGFAVVLDAVHARPEERAAAAVLAHRHGVPFSGLWLNAASERLVERISARPRDASDATPTVVRQQLGYDVGAMEWPVVEAEGTPASVLARARAAIGTDRAA